MAEIQRTSATKSTAATRTPVTRAPSPLTALRKPLLMRKCGCGGHTSGGGTCDKCKEEAEAKVQRRALAGNAVLPSNLAPPVVHQALHSGGSPLDASSRAYMEPRFGRDFSRVRVHTGALAAESARSVGAAAYTVGPHIVFGAGRGSGDRDLLAHELAHVSQQSGVMGIPDRLEVDHAGSHAEHEAERVAADVGNAQAPQTGVQPQGAKVSRKLEGAVVGGGAGLVAGVAVGAIFGGPIGALVGGLVGLGAGALIGHLLTQGKAKEDPKALPGRRILDLLETGVLKWSVTADDAQQALSILLSLPPLDMLGARQNLQRKHLWQRMLDHLSSDEETKVITEIEAGVASPEKGYITPGDKFLVEYRETGGTQSDKLKAFSIEYEVHGDSLALPFIEPLKVVGMTVKDAATAIGIAYLERGDDYQISMSATYRNPSYFDYQPPPYVSPSELSSKSTSDSGFSSSSDSASKPPPRFFIQGDTTQLPEAQRQRKVQQFIEYLQYNVPPGMLQRAQDYYFGKIRTNLSDYEAPEKLWEEAKVAAPQPDPAAPSPAKAFLDLGEALQTRAQNEKSPSMKTTLEGAYGRYVSWVSAHMDDPKLATYNPFNIYSQVFRNALNQDAKEFEANYIHKLQDTKEKEHDDKAGAKFAEGLDYMMKTVLVPQRTRSVSSHQERLNDNNDVVTDSWLLTPSDEEIAIRQKIATMFIDDMSKHMMDDNFNDTTIKADFGTWLKGHPAESNALYLATAYMHVEKFEDPVDVPMYQHATEIVIGFIPFAGQIAAGYEVISGEDLFGHPLSPASRAILAASILLPAAGKVAKVGKAAIVASRMAPELRMTAAESNAFFHVMAGLAPDTRAAQAINKASKMIRNNEPLDQATLKAATQGLKDSGLADEKMLQTLSDDSNGLLKGVKDEAKLVAKQEVSTLGAMSDESAEALAKDAPLRHALIENSLAASVLKKCNSPCYPPGLTVDQVQFVEREMRRLSATKKFFPDDVRQFLYMRRNDLNKALGDLSGMNTGSELGDARKALSLDQFLAAKASNKITMIPAREDPAGMMMVRDRAYDIGEMQGRSFAVKKGLSGTGFNNPFRSIGRYGQGLDDVMVQGSNIDKDVLYIVEYKGGTSTLSTGQMERSWVVGNIKRLRDDGGTIGQFWADKLEAALKQGRLKGLVVSTPVVNGAPGISVEINAGKYVY